MEPVQPVDRTPAEPIPPTPGPAASTPPTSAVEPTPAAADRARVEPARVEPARVEPARVEPASVEPARVEPARVEPAPGGPQAPPGREKSRSERSSKDMAISLLVLLVPIALLLAFYRGFLGGEQPNTVDPATALEQARAANVFPISQPTGLGSDWKTLNASYRTVEGGADLRIGYLTPEGRGAQLVQSSVPPERLLPSELTASAQPQGPTEVGGRNWQRYTARGNEQALVLLEPGRTVIVVGDARENELRRLADSLR
ncbi:DUF4245 family protein [Micromonospora sp. DT233]|uniref:DUF4245 domain-containing protein n=1 Tax=Micromonospora sp. DT233 TaxID=3393432 RepID=UPI003CEB9274